MERLLLGRNRAKERGHTVSYGSLNSVLRELGLPSGSLGDTVQLTLEDERTTMTFRFNEGRCYCGINDGALNAPNRSVIYIVSARFI
jgi:hypothetical protein